MLIWSFLSIFGLFIARRTLRTVENLAQTSFLNQKTKSFCVFSVVLLLNWCLRHNYFLLGALFLVISITPEAGKILIFQRRKRIFQIQSVSILDELILMVSAGQSFRQSLHQCGHNRHFWIQEALNNSFFTAEDKKSRQNLARDRRIRRFFDELIEIDTSGVKILDRLRSFRRTWAMEEQFRQRSRQALIQVRVQSWVMVALFLLVLSVSWKLLSISQQPFLIVISSVWCFFGVFWIQSMGRWYKWKI